MAGGQFSKKLFQILFYFHLILIAILALVLTIKGLVSARRHHFYPDKWYPPLLISIACAGVFSFTWQWITLLNPSKALRAAFWLSPLLTCAISILLVLVGSTASSSIGAVILLFALIQSLYACWVNPRFEYASKVLSVSIAFPPANTTKLVSLSIAVGVLFSCFVVSGIGGATATSTGVDIFFISAMVISLWWSMQVIKNTQQVTISRVRHLNFATGADMDDRIAFRDTVRELMGRVCIGSTIVPVVVVVRGFSRGIKLIAGDKDEFLFSCANCFSSVAKALASYGNRWGFVQVGAYDKDFVQASIDTWEMFRRRGLEQLIDSDLTSSFCFLCGMIGGAICSLVAGTWALVIHKNYATELSIYAFLIGYFMCRVAMAWPQACVSAYYVAYAENPQNMRFDSTIPDRLQELQRYSV